MATIYLLEPGSTLYKEHLRFVIWVPDEQKIEVPIREVERILVFGNIQVTTQAINACLEQQILVLFLSTTGQYKGHIWNWESNHLGNELIQIEKRQDPQFQFLVSQAIVRGKLANSRQLLMRLNRKRKVAEVSQAIAGIGTDISALDTVNNLDSLRGYEGVGAARYFPAFGQLITNPEFSFSLRYRQPPTDPVNSLLSFGYTLLFNNVLSLIVAEGLSPYFANLHYGEDKKPYLAFDLMEEFRSPIVDSLVLKLINSAVFKSRDFETVVSTGGVYLRKESRRIFLQHFEKRMNEELSHPDLLSQVSYRHAIQLQIRRYKRSLLHSIAYEPFLRTA
ncbi:CRISPR-associated protein Cas1 [Crinalium epipsammum PCC 9333]|uniref:CRISPR-associated endonuclease Cas1 n=2 Tax=Crinalium TaxID=241421 RepID=K9VWP1_9CYAN|nr:CRISPR-associated protein Cas1 [Crinalium epipsammum PCC 9333]